MDLTQSGTDPSWLAFEAPQAAIGRRKNKEKAFEEFVKEQEAALAKVCCFKNLEFDY